jgi:hypothetical protein
MADEAALTEMRLNGRTPDLRCDLHKSLLSGAAADAATKSLAPAHNIVTMKDAFNQPATFLLSTKAAAQICCSNMREKEHVKSRIHH